LPFLISTFFKPVLIHSNTSFLTMNRGKMFTQTNFRKEALTFSLRIWLEIPRFFVCVYLPEKHCRFFFVEG
jgi:hypothetical protein